MQDKTNPGAMSKEAFALLQSGALKPSPSLLEKPIQAIRQENRAAIAANSQQALETYGVQTGEISIAGIDCLEVSPRETIERREILYAFGGGFVQGGAFEDLSITAALSAKTGAKIICPHYRLAPENPYPAGLDDLTRVAQLLLSQNPKLQFCGESAGGNLVLALIHRLRTLKKPLPIAVAALSPVSDLNYMGDSLEMDRDPTLKAARRREIREAYIGNDDATIAEVSPIHGAFDKDFPKTFLTTGTRDLLLSDCVRLATVMRQAAAPVELRVWEGMWHVFEYYSEIPEAEASLDEISQFLLSNWS